MRSGYVFQRSATSWKQHHTRWVESLTNATGVEPPTLNWAIYHTLQPQTTACHFTFTCQTIRSHFYKPKFNTDWYHHLFIWWSFSPIIIQQQIIRASRCRTCTLIWALYIRACWCQHVLQSNWYILKMFHDYMIETLEEGMCLPEERCYQPLYRPQDSSCQHQDNITLTTSHCWPKNMLFYHHPFWP